MRYKMKRKKKFQITSDLIALEEEKKEIRSKLSESIVEEKKQHSQLL